MSLCVNQIIDVFLSLIILAIDGVNCSVSGRLGALIVLSRSGFNSSGLSHSGFQNRSCLINGSDIEVWKIKLHQNLLLENFLFHLRVQIKKPFPKRLLG